MPGGSLPWRSKDGIMPEQYRPAVRSSTEAARVISKRHPGIVAVDGWAVFGYKVPPPAVTKVAVARVFVSAERATELCRTVCA
jgi:hypothetical protein